MAALIPDESLLPFNRDPLKNYSCGPYYKDYDVVITMSYRAITPHHRFLHSSLWRRNFYSTGHWQLSGISNAIYNWRSSIKLLAWYVLPTLTFRSLNQNDPSFQLIASPFAAGVLFFEPPTSFVLLIFYYIFCKSSRGQPNHLVTERSRVQLLTVDFH